MTRFGVFLVVSLLSSCLLATAPVVDNSDDFALLEEPTTSSMTDEVTNEQTALVQEDNEIAPNEADLVHQIKHLQQALQELRGQLEIQAHELKQIKQAQANNKPSLNTNHDEAPEPLSTTTSSYPSTKHHNPVDEQVQYLAAYDLVKEKQFDKALVAMQTFLKTYPHSGYAPNAHYWTGELYMLKKAYPQAISHFTTVLSRYPESSKAPACSLKIGYALAASGQISAARSRLDSVVHHFPDTPTADLALIKLKTLHA